jgi:UDP-glucose/GDP-mannose dehydrogenase family, UDP binding domain
MSQAREVLGGIEFADGPYACAEGADALVIVTEWEQFRALDFERLRSVMKQPGAGRLAQRLPPGGHRGLAGRIAGACEMVGKGLRSKSLSSHSCCHFLGARSRFFERL